MTRSTKADPPSVWVFDPEQLMLGDIVLERGTTLGGAVVAAITNGPFSHAMIWVGNDFVEAMPGGVRSLSFARVPLQVPENWALLRAKPRFQPMAAVAAQNARGMVFKGYDLVGAALTQLGGRQSAAPNSRFCSQLVVEAYSSAGLDILPGLRPGQADPNMLAEVKTHDRLELPLMQATRVTGGEPYPQDMLDRSKAFRSAPMQQEAEIARALFTSVEKLIRKVELPAEWVDPRPGNLSEVLDLLPLLPRESSFPIADRLLKEMDQRGYFDLLAPGIAALWDKIDKSDQHQIRGWAQTRDRHQTNAGSCLQRYGMMPHPLWLRLQVMYFLNASAFAGLIEKAS